MRITRDNGAGSIDAVVTVVEFGLAANVYKGSITNFRWFELSKTITLPSAVDRSKSFLVFWHRTDQTITDYNVSSLDGRFLNDTNIVFSRDSVGLSSTDGGEVYGHWWVVEAVNDEFSVVNATDNNFSGTSLDLPLGTSVDLTKSFLLYSHQVDQASPADEARAAHAECYLADASTVTCDRHNLSGDIDSIRAQVVSFSGDSNVQRGTTTLGTGLTTGNATLSSAVDPAWAHAFSGGLGHAGIAAKSGGPAAAGSVATEARTLHTTVELTSGTTVQTRRASTNGDAQAIQEWEVIEWLD